MSGYSDGGASRRSNVLKAWHPQHLSAASDIDLNYQTLRNRAADLARNTALGHAAISTSARLTIGSGLKVFPRPDHRRLGINAAQARDWARHVSNEFRLWAATPDCDLARRNNFGDLQHIAYESYLVDGDVFCLFRRKTPTPRNPYTLRLQLIEGNRVSTPTDGTVVNQSVVEGRAPNGNRIINGIEVDRDGEQMAIHVSNKVPNDIVERDRVVTWARVKIYGASGYPNVLQISHDQRPGQYRGVPYLASVIEPLKQAARYTNAELSSAIVKSFFSLFFTQPLQNYGVDEILEKAAMRESGEDADVDISEYKLGVGTLNALPRGVDVKTVDSGASTSAFASFNQEIVKQIGAALGIPCECLLMSFNASYSASRAALLQANEEIKRRRAWFVRDFMQPVYEAWLTEAVAFGRVDAKGYFEDPVMRSAWSAAEYYGPTMSSIDPLKEAQAAALLLELGLTTHEREAAEMSGADWEQMVEQLAYESGIKKPPEGGD